MKPIAIILLTLAIAVPATWFATQHFAAPTVATPAGGARKILYYQSAMHPWVKSDKPGRCTICGMQLTPVYEGEKGFEAGGNMVSLSESMVRVLHVQTIGAKRQPLTKTLNVAGMIDDNATRHRLISAYVAGRVQKLHVNFIGAEVAEGQALADYYSPALLQAEREYRLLTGEMRKNVALRLIQMGLTAAQIEALPEKSGDKLTTEILSPIGGTVVSQNVYEGQYVQEGEKLLEIGDFSTMWFQFLAYEQDLPWIKPGLKVDIRTPSHPGKTFTGSITFIDPNFDETTRSTKVRVELENPLVEGRRLLLHRLYADGLVRLDAPEVLAIPRTAVIQTGAEAVAYVDEGKGVYSRRVVKLGRRGDEVVEVLAGLKVGDKVVTNGNLLMDGQAEMNRSFSASPSKAAPALSDAQRNAVENFIKAADAIAAALSKDDLAAFNKAGPDATTVVESLSAAFADRADLADALEKLKEARHLHAAADLDAARKMFLSFSTAAVTVLEPLRKGDKPVDVEVFECPMVNKAVPDAPKKGRWLQLAGTEIRNPYFGAEMLDCGVKVKP